MAPLRRQLLAKERGRPNTTKLQLCGFFFVSTAVLYISSVSKSLSPLQKLIQPLQSTFQEITLQAAAPSILEHVPASNQTGLLHSLNNGTILESGLVGDEERIGIDGVRLESGRDFQANALNVSFACNFTLSPGGEACFSFQVEVLGPTNKCLFPYLRLRLTGAALVHVALQRTRELDPFQWEGCVMMPVPGTYYVDANLIHCLLDPFKPNMTPASLKLEAGSPVRPDFAATQFTPYSFSVAPFNRTPLLPSPSSSMITTAYSNYSWVFAPLCRNTLYRVARHCGKRKAGKFLSTKFQMNEWLRANAVVSFKKPRVRYRYDGYMWLPVNPRTGSIDYAAEHFGYQYTPPPSFLTTDDDDDDDAAGRLRKNQTILFVGSSHVRYLMNQVSQIYYNLTYGLDGCTEEHTPPPDLSNNVSRFHLGETTFFKLNLFIVNTCFISPGVHILMQLKFTSPINGRN